MRSILALALFALGAYIGNRKTESLRLRLELMEGFRHDLSVLGRLMEYRPLPIRELIGKEKGFVLGEFWKRFAAALPEHTELSGAWSRAMEECAADDRRFSRLRGDEVHMLEDFGAALGRGDIAAEKGNLALALSAIGERIDSVKAEYGKKGRMYRSLGLLGGLAAAIIVW